MSMERQVSANINGQEAEVIAFVDPSIKDQVDLSFLPSGTRFVSTVPEIWRSPEPCRLILASGNIQTVLDTTFRWLDNEDTVIEILWNFEKNPDYAYALLTLSKNAPYSNFRKFNSTAHLVLSSNKKLASALPPSQLTPTVTTLLEETSNENASVPPEVLKQLLWRHSYLLDQIEPLSNKIQNLTNQLSQSKAATTAARALVDKTEDEKATVQELSDENENLRRQLSELQSSLSSLQEQYDALSNSKLGAFTLKYWDKRRK